MKKLMKPNKYVTESFEMLLKNIKSKFSAKVLF